MNYVMLLKWVTGFKNSWTTLVVNKVSSLNKMTAHWWSDTGDRRGQVRASDSDSERYVDLLCCRRLRQWRVCWCLLRDRNKLERAIVCVCASMCWCFPFFLFFIFALAVCEDVSAMWAKVVGMQNMCNLYAEWLIRWNGAVINVALIDKVVVVVITVWANNRATKRSKHTWQLKASRWHTTRQNVIDCHWSEGGKEMPRGMYR